MTATVEPFVMPEGDARRLTEQIRLMATNVAEGVEKLKRLVTEAREGSAHTALGYRSWTEYLADVLGDEPMRLEKDARRELVGVLTEQGMSTRAIAPIVGVSKSQVAADLQVSSSGQLDSSASARDRKALVGNPTTKTTELSHDAHDAEPDPDAEPMTEAEYARQAEAIEAEVRQQEQPPTVTGLDGKTYTKPQRQPDLPEGAPGPRARASQQLRVLRGLGERCRGFADGGAIAEITDITDALENEEAAQLVDDLSKGIRALSRIRRLLNERTNSRKEV